MGKNLTLALMASVIFLTIMTVAQKTDAPKQPTTKSLAQQHSKELLLLMDADKNGKISKQEWMKFMEAQFDAMDEEKTGELDQKELVKSLVTVKPLPPANVGK
jgi:CRISPR/Cas system-associated endonuclease Cas3-HD